LGLSRLESNPHESKDLYGVLTFIANGILVAVGLSFVTFVGLLTYAIIQGHTTACTTF
jgi:hypothetical protein